ncbi:MAG: ParB/RepB/Spo0J family partition protein, partial [Desulfitobacterium hafniense]|nr:ParB/RepB/Spo0J family partition protein [Desulfitobacterium hafniense]
SDLKIACIVQSCSEQEMAERALIENIQRDNLNPVEEGFAYAKLIEEYGLTQDEVAKRVGKGRPTISNLLRITQLPDPVLLLLRSDKLSLGHAKVLASLSDSSLQVLFAQKIAKEQLSVRETEEMIKSIGDRTSTKKNTIPKTPTELNEVEDKLRVAFQTKVRLKGEKTRGKIEIEYFSEEELNRLLDMWKVIID